MVTQEFLPFTQVVAQITTLCAERRSGTVFIVSDDNRAGQLHLVGGEIVLTVCRGRRGQEGLALMRTIGHARLRFDDGVVSAAATPPAGATDAILAFLADGIPLGHPGFERRASQREPAPVVRLLDPMPAPLAPHIVARIETILVKYIGPMAQIVCQEHLARAATPAALAHALAGEIPGPGKAAQFEAEVARSLAE